ncbi:CNNM domain-containing protein, partial [Pseudomonas veronii]|uniref:CNNM domain-containing protein n=1 Tax=Pseudomonas veronii TaxID=76761 RepID=UPI001CA43DCD
WLSKLLHPVVAALNWTANLVLRALRIEPKDEVASSYTLEEVQSIVAESTRSGTLDDESGVLHSALEFSPHRGAVGVRRADPAHARAVAGQRAARG